MANKDDVIAEDSDEKDPVYEALKAMPPEELRNTQKHVSRDAIAGVPQGRRVLDRNGNPTDVVTYGMNEPFQMTMKHLGQIKAMAVRDTRKESAEEIKTLRRQVEQLQTTCASQRKELDELSAAARSYDRAGREEKIQERIRQACEQQTSKLQDEIRTLRSEVSTLKSENAELREAKRRLKAARQGS